MMNLNSALQQQLGQQQQQQQPQDNQDEAAQAMSGIGANIAYRRATPQSLINQREYAKVLHGLFQKGDELMPSVSQYAGIAGKLKKGHDMVKTGLGSNSPQYADYLQFTRVVAPMLANEMRRSLGGQATNYEAKLMQNIIKPDYWDSNPQTAMKNFKDLENIFRTKIIPILAENISEAPKELKQIGQESEQQQQNYKVYNPQTGRIE